MFVLSIAGHDTKPDDDIKGREVAVYWYKTMSQYYFLKDPAVLHAYQGKLRPTRVKAHADQFPFI